jgi:hypothetical protein
MGSKVFAALGYWPAFPLVVLALLVMAGVPFLFAKVIVDDSGITQQVLKRRTVRWTDITGWERTSHPGADGPDTLTIHARSGPLTLNHNCVYGKRLDEIEAELKKRIQPRDSA